MIRQLSLPLLPEMSVRAGADRRLCQHFLEDERRCSRCQCTVSVVRTCLLLAFVAATGCKETLKWKPQQLKTVEVGPFTFDIPKGWRDTRESEDPKLAHQHERLGADTDAHILVRENASNTDANISFMWTDLVGAPTCEQFVEALSLAGGFVIDKATLLHKDYGAEKGCGFAISDDTYGGKMHLRFRGGKFLTIQCMRPKAGDADADEACESFALALNKQ